MPFIIIEILDGHPHWALALFVLAGLSDGLDGLLARRLHQQTMLGQYLDPIADKLLLSTLFLVLSFLHKIAWKFTVIVFSRDLSILATCAVLYATTGLRDFRPSYFGKANTLAQVSALFFVLLFESHRVLWVGMAKTVSLWATFCLTVLSGVHYVFLAGQRLRSVNGQAA